MENIRMATRLVDRLYEKGNYHVLNLQDMSVKGLGEGFIYGVP